MQTRAKAQQRARRTRASIKPRSERLRLSVHISNRHVVAQIIDDATATTRCYATTVGSKVTGTMSEKAAQIGAIIAEAAKTAKIKQVVFDRGERRYHGRVKALADAARDGGLEF